MNIKVVAFTASENYIIIHLNAQLLHRQNNLKGTVTLKISMFYQKELYKP